MSQFYPNYINVNPWQRHKNVSKFRVSKVNKAVYTTAPVAEGLGRGSNDLGRGSNNLGWGSNDLGRGSNDLGRGMLKYKLFNP